MKSFFLHLHRKSDFLYLILKLYLYKYINTNNTFQKYQEKIFQNPKQLIAHSSGIYIACKDGIYKYTKMDGTDPILEYSINDGIDTIDIESLNN